MASAKEGLKEQRPSSEATSPPTPQTFAREHQTWDIENVEESFIPRQEKKNLDGSDDVQFYWHDKEIPQ